MLTVKEVTSGYGRVPAISSVSATVNDNEIVAVIGANGAGKSTFLKTLAGQLRCSSGEIRFADEVVTSLPVHKRVGRGIVLVPEGRHVFAPMTVLQNLRMGAYHRRRRDEPEERSIERVMTIFPVLAQRARQRAGTLSGGEQQMLAIARGLMSDPALLLLDEPSLGLAPLITGQIMDKVRELNDEHGLACLLVEQNAHLALAISHRAYVFESGRVVLEGDAADLRNDARIREAYLSVAGKPL
ncbi:MAG: ABC transporter ATP-binding protein [Acidimicrobiia bacterium]